MRFCVCEKFGMNKRSVVDNSCLCGTVNNSEKGVFWVRFPWARVPTFIPKVTSCHWQ